MAGKQLSRFRLLLNGAGCTAIVLLCLPAGALALLQWASGGIPDGADPKSDSARMVQGVSTMLGIFGLVALVSLVSLVRTVRAWRRLKQEQANRPPDPSAPPGAPHSAPTAWE